MNREQALILIVEASARYPKLGWDAVNAMTDFQGKIMNRPGGTFNNFVEALDALGLSRDDAVEAFLSARGMAARTAAKPDAPVVEPQPVPVPAAVPAPAPAPAAKPPAPPPPAPLPKAPAAAKPKAKAKPAVKPVPLPKPDDGPQSSLF